MALRNWKSKLCGDIPFHETAAPKKKPIEVLKYFLIYFSFLSQSWAYVPSVTSTGVPIQWKSPAKLNLSGNPINTSQLSTQDFYKGVVMGLQRWKTASGGGVNFDYWQGTDSKVFPSDSKLDGLSNIYFASQRGAPGRSSARTLPTILGVTQVWYHTDTGEILETDIELNDIDFQFTNVPSDTSGFGTPNLPQRRPPEKSRVYVQNVITHELGHAFGLSHSGELQSSMLFMESPEQAHLSCDDLIAIHALYPTQDQGQRGSIRGQVHSESGAPLFGAHVLAISQIRGTALASALSDPSGEFLIDALEPGTYYLMVEPFYAGPPALPSFFAKIDSGICPEHTAFSRTFLLDVQKAQLAPIVVQSSEVTRSPTLVVQCAPSGGASVAASASSTTLTSTTQSFGIVDRMDRLDRANPTQPGFYQLRGISGKLRIHSLAYSLYSPIQTYLSLWTSAGDPVESQIFDPIYEGESGYINRDSALWVNNLTLGDYVLQVSADTLTANEYPAGPVALDSVPFLALTFSINQPDPHLSRWIPDNARCQIQENFPPYSSPPYSPSSPSARPQSQGSCGTLQIHQADRSNNEQNTQTSFYRILGWFLPWLFMAVLSKSSIHLRQLREIAIFRR